MGYNIISHTYFDNLIMTCIVTNTVVMALTIFPEPVEGWKDFKKIANYIFAGIYTV